MILILIILLIQYCSIIVMEVIQSRTIIIGGGIHGVSTAYYLAQKGIKSLIIEKSKIASAASGKAGGFLAREWGNGVTIPLHQKSFDLHKQLAHDLNIQSYRQVNTLNVNSNKGSNVPAWLDLKVSSKLMDHATAQVTPLELTEKMLQSLIHTNDVEVMIDTVNGIECNGNNKITGVKTKTNGIISTNKVLICLGPWSGVAVEDWFGLSLPMEGVKSTSLVYKDLQAIQEDPYACFCEEDQNHCHLELYPRPNGEMYICGCGGSDYVSGDRLREGGDCYDPMMIVADPKRIYAASQSLKQMSSIFNREPDITQACMRPCTPDALPVMGEIPGFEGCYISCGHNCWGILWAPISGLAMSELIIHGKSTSINLEPFSPSRYMNKEEVSITTRGRKKGIESIGEQW